MTLKTIVYDTVTDRHAVFDHPSQVSDWVNQQLGRPTDASVDVIPARYHVMDVPYHAAEGLS